MGRGITDILAFVQEIYTVSRGSIRASKLAATSNNLTPGPWRDGHKNADVHPLFLAANLDLQNNFARMFKTRGQKLHHRPRFLRALFRPRFRTISFRAENEFGERLRFSRKIFISFDACCPIIRMVLIGIPYNPRNIVKLS